MANRRLNQFQYSYERDVVSIYAAVTFGAAGAPTLGPLVPKGVKSVVRLSAGDFVITLQDSFNKLLMLDTRFQNAAGIPSTGIVGIKANNVSSATAPSIEIVMTAGGVATDPAVGDIVYIKMVCRNAST